MDVRTILHTYVIPNAGPIATVFAAFVAGTVTIILGLAQWKIASRQAKTAENAALTARNKLRLDMYDRRIAVFNAFMDLISKVTTHGYLHEGDETDFLQGISGARWSVGPEVRQYVDDVFWPAVLRFQRTQGALQQGSMTTDRARLVERKAEARDFLMSKREEVIALFSKHLEFE